MFDSKTVTTAGEMIELLRQFPVDKPIIMDEDGNTWSPEVYNWAEGEDDDINWPLAIR